MIKVTYRGYPTNFTTNYTVGYNSIEDALRAAKQRDAILVAIEEPEVGFHKVPLTKDGAVALSPLNYSVPRGGSMYESEKFKEAEAKITEENNKPKLA